MSEQVVPYKTAVSGELMEAVLIGGDLAALSPKQRLEYYLALCNSMGLNPETKPFDYIELNKKLVLYANRNCAEQLRNNRKVSVTIPAREVLNDGTIYVVTAKATLPDGRADESTGVVSIKGIQGEFLANAMMKAETKAKRRVTLSICGLGMLDETEAASIPNAKSVVVDVVTGEIVTPVAKSPGADDAPEAGVKPAQAATPEMVQDAKGRILAEIRLTRQTKPSLADKPMTDTQRGMLFAALTAAKVVTDADRHALLLYLLGHQSTTTMTQAEATAVGHWLNDPNRDGEVAAVVRAGHLALGQAEMQVEAA